MKSRFVRICWVCTAAVLAWTFWVLREAGAVGPLTTLAPYSLTVERARLESGAMEDSGIGAVLAVLVETHKLLDQEFVAARRALDERLEVETKLADTASGGQEEDASHLLNVGVTVTAIGDLDRCEFELRRAAALAAQLVIDTGESAVLRVSSEVFDEFDRHIAAATRFLGRLDRANLESARSWSEWGRRLEEGRSQLRVRWGIAEDRARAGSVDSELNRRQIASSDLQRIGQEELSRWRKK